MKSKTEKDCNGIETQIFEKIKKGELSWFPRGRSLSLGLNILYFSHNWLFFRKGARIWDINFIG